MDNQYYTTDSELIRCSFCGTTVSTALKICPTCGSDIRPQQGRALTWGVAALLVVVFSLALAMGLSSENSRLNSVVRSALARLDALATSLDPRLVQTATPEVAPIGMLLPTSTPGQLTTEVSNGSVSPGAVDEEISASSSITSTENESAAPLEATPTETATSAPTETPAATQTPLATETATATPSPLATETATEAATATSQGRANSLRSSALLTNTLTPSADTFVVSADAAISESSEITDVLSLLVSTPTPTTAIATEIATETATATPFAYEVKTGDTLFTIAANFNITLDELLAANGYASGRAPVIRPGQRLKIPNQPVAESTSLEVALAPTATATKTATATVTATETATETPTETAAPTATATVNATATKVQTETVLLIATATSLRTPTAVLSTTSLLRATATATEAVAVEPTPAPLTYVVQSGDSPSSIARRYGISASVLLAANGLTLNDATRIRVGQTLIIPGTQAPPNSTANTAAPVQSYVVQSGDTPLSIANRYGISVDTLLAANGLTRDDATRMRPGQTLVIPGGQATKAPTATAQPTATAVPVQSYVVQAGDTPLEIANRYGVSVDALLAANGLTRADATRIRPGQTLLIPGSDQAQQQTPVPTKAAITSGTTDTATIRLDAPKMRSPENGTTVSCGNTNQLIWEPVPYIRDSDRYLLHLGYVSSTDSSGTPIVTWLLLQERLPSDPQWTMDNNLCAFAPQGFDRQWRWYVEVVDPTSGNTVVSAPGEVYAFRWQ